MELVKTATRRKKKQTVVVDNAVQLPNRITQFFIETNYDKFDYVKGNRKVDENAVKRLVKSMRTDGNLSVIVVAENPNSKNGKWLIVDGQHRLEACRRLNMPAQVGVLDRPLSALEIAGLNARQKAWTLQNYLEAKSIEGDAAANFILHQAKKMGVEIGTSFSPSALWVLLLGVESLTGKARRDAPLHIPAEAYETFDELRPKYISIMKALDMTARIVFKQVGFVKALHDLLVLEEFKVPELVAVLEAGHRPALMGGARGRGDNLKVLINFYCNNTGKSEAFKKKLMEKVMPENKEMDGQTS